jgi:hypothetical protein
MSKQKYVKWKTQPVAGKFILEALATGGIWTSEDLKNKIPELSHLTKEHIRDVAVWMIRFGGHAESMGNFHIFQNGPMSKVKRTISAVEGLAGYHESRKIKPGEKVCRLCGLHGGFDNVQSIRCYSCGEEKKSSLPEAIANDPRWIRIIAKGHGTRQGCIVCGSSRAAARDGRYCHWTHDVTMLNEHELHYVLEQYGMPDGYYDQWGRVRESAATR